MTTYRSALVELGPQDVTFQTPEGCDPHPYSAEPVQWGERLYLSVIWRVTPPPWPEAPEKPAKPSKKRKAKP